MFSFSAVFWMNNLSSGFNWIGKKKALKCNDTYIVILSCAPLIRQPDGHLKFECNVLHSNVDFYFKFDEYSIFFFFDSPTNNLSHNVGKTKEVVMDFRRNSVDHPHWPSTARLWRESAALNSWGCTSQRISPGPPTPCHSPRRHNSALSLPAEKSKSPSTHPHHILQRHHWECADQLHMETGMGTAVLLTARPSSGQWTQLQRSSVPLSHPSWTFSLQDAPAKPTVSWRTPPIPPQSLPAPTIRKTVPEHQSLLRQTAQQLFPPGCESPELKSPRPPLKPHANPYLLKHGPSPPTPSKYPPTLPHQRKKRIKLFCAIRSVLHTGEWACTNHL